MTARFSTSSVDWNLVDRELDSLPSDYRAQRFDSLKHVVEILSGVDPKDLVEELTASKARLEKLISNVVDVYHNGFNLALQNYSKILQLFNESREQVDSIQLALQEARRRLGAQNLSLETHWQRSVKLDTICKILDVVESLTAIPAQIDAFQAQRDWPAAVSLLLDTCNRMNRKELEKIQALDKIKDDLETRWKMLISQITDEIEQMVFSRDLCHSENDKDTTPVVTPSKLALKKFSGGRAGHSPKHSRFSSILSAGSNDRDLHGAIHRSTSSNLLRSRFSFRLHETNNVVPEQLEWSVEALIDCLSQMGCLSQAKESLRKGLIKNIKSIIANAMHKVKKEDIITQDIPAFGPQQQMKTDQNLSIPPIVAQASEIVLTSVFARVQRVLENATSVFKLIAIRDSNTTTAALVRPAFLQKDDGSIKQEQSTETTSPNIGGQELRSMLGFDYLDAACLDFWNTVQDELIHIVAEMLNVPMKQADVRDATDSMARVWLNRLDEKKSVPTGKTTKAKSSTGTNEKKSRLSFSFGIDVETLNKSKNLIGDSIEKTDTSYAKHIRDILNHPGGAYLAPVVYKATQDFLTFTKNHISMILRDYESVTGTLIMDSAKSLNDGGLKLKTFLENFVMETFLPQVWVDFRGRVTASMEDPEAFRPQIHTRSTSKIPDHGEMVLRAGTVAEKMVKEVMTWVISMPPFASSLTGVIENILGRVQEAFAANVNQVLADSTSGKLAINQELAFLMMLESDAELISDASQFYVVGPGENVDHSITPAPYPLSSMESDLTEGEIFKAVLNERPIRVESVIARPGNFWKMVQLAALSDTLDFVAHCILEVAMHHPEITNSPSSSTENPKSSYRKHKMNRKSSTNLQWDGLSTSLAMLIDRYRSLSGICVRCMRLEMVTLSVHYLSQLSDISHLCDEEEQKEIPFFIGALIKNAARAQEEISPHLSQKKMQYILNILPSACCRMLIDVLPTLGQMNQSGIERMQRIVAFLKPAILSLIGNGSAAERQKYFDHANDYFSLLSLSIQDFMNYVRRRPGKFMFREFKAVLAIHIPGRRVPDACFNEVESLTDKMTEARLKKLQQMNIKRGRSHSKH